ncbi:uroporphyrinogen-III synthase [Sphingomonas sp. M1-B02]|uniref:uroporphyrinogen-III synthase n=1 Tax=Sphingomonas sp. M1-B02 TaxID=3114300 RepID=UPI00223F5BCE|nr:uroporphyrinogen-III synthase [Sphingomonas sp. S6-11]UZK65174.1 uroporphyrinogen-III synthase [Sphingomonas sp. S6-11]
MTAAAIEARGRTAIRLPLFEARPVAWESPDPARFDALLLTSANALRHGGAGLASLRELPVFAVGAVTAEAARRAGFEMAEIGDDGATGLVARAEAAGLRRALHLAGRERTLEAGGIVAEVITVYASEALAVTHEAVRRLAGSVVLVQSARAGARLAELVDAAGLDRGGIALVAISAAAAATAGPGWAQIHAPADMRGEALIDAAIALAD